MARIIPTDEFPGATEADCVEFVDRYLSGVGFIYAKPDGRGFETLTGRSSAAGCGASKSCVASIARGSKP